MRCVVQPRRLHSTHKQQEKKMKASTKIKFAHYKRKLKECVVYPFNAIHNYFLVRKYPFLIPSCGWSTDMCFHPNGYKYHYEETWLDCLPNGWRKAFGKDICDELKREIANSNLTDYKVQQVKEKFGALCWYDDGGDEYTRQIINKYANLSQTICQKCGKKAEYVTTRWVGYYCGDCIKKMGPNAKYKPINESTEDTIVLGIPLLIDAKTIEKYYGYDFKLTSIACPEQYEVYKDGEWVGYVRERHGHLTAHYVINDKIDWNNPFIDSDDYAEGITDKDTLFKQVTDKLNEHLETN